MTARTKHFRTDITRCPDGANVTEVHVDPGEWFYRCDDCGGPVHLTNYAGRVLTGHADGEQPKAVFKHSYGSDWYWVTENTTLVVDGWIVGWED